MAVLHNRVSQKELKQKLFEETVPRTTISFYHYFPIEDPKAFRDILYKNLDEIKVFGRIYVAHEGINAQVSIPENRFEDFKKYLYSIEPLNGIRLNIAVDAANKSRKSLRKLKRQLIWTSLKLKFKSMLSKKKSF